MEQQIFSDGIGRISVIGGIVRLDLVTYSATEADAGGQPRPILTQRLVMGVDGFLRSSEKILEAVQAITRAQGQPAAAPVPQSSAPIPAPPIPAPAPPPAEPAPSPWTAPAKPRAPFP